MRYTAIQVMKKLAAEKFKLSDMEFAGFERIDTTVSSEIVEGDEDIEAQVDVWANFTLRYEGDPPDSYRTINAMIMDWVDEHDKELRETLCPKLIPWLAEQYKGADLSEIEQDPGDFIWEDQVDYMPEVDEDKKTITFTVELMLDVSDEDVDD